MNRTRIDVAHHVTALKFYNITRCYGKHVAVLAFAVAMGDIIKYQSFVYGSFVWGIHVRFNDNITRCYGKHVAVLAVAVATGDIINYQSFVYGSFVSEIHERYNNLIWPFTCACLSNH